MYKHASRRKSETVVQKPSPDSSCILDLLQCTDLSNVLQLGTYSSSVHPSCLCNHCIHRIDSCSLYISCLHIESLEMGSLKNTNIEGEFILLNTHISKQKYRKLHYISWPLLHACITLIVRVSMCMYQIGEDFVFCIISTTVPCMHTCSCISTSVSITLHGMEHCTPASSSLEHV